MMKKFFSCLTVCVAAGALALSCSNLSKKGPRGRDIAGKLEVVSTRIPGPLADYVSLADDVIPYEVSEPDSDGDVLLTLYFDFKILKHVSHMPEDFDIVGNIKSHTMKSVGNFQVASDDDAVAMLADAISNPDVSHITVPWHEVGRLEDVNEFKANARKLEFTKSRIWLDINPENFRVAGIYSSAIHLSDNPSMRISTSDTGKCDIGLYVNLDSIETVSGQLIANPSQLKAYVMMSTGEPIALNLVEERNLEYVDWDRNNSFLLVGDITYKNVDRLLNGLLPVIELCVD